MTGKRKLLVGMTGLGMILLLSLLRLLTAEASNAIVFIVLAFVGGNAIEHWKGASQ